MDTLKGISRVKVELDISDVCAKKHALTPEQVTLMLKERLLQTGLRIIEGQTRKTVQRLYIQGLLLWGTSPGVLIVLTS